MNPAGRARKWGAFDLSLAANLFHGSQRSGATLGAAYSAVYAGNQFKVQGLLGDFSGFSLRPVLQLLPTSFGGTVEVDQATQHVQGAAYGFSVVDSFKPFQLNQLSLTGLWERYSRNFLVLREDATYSAVSRESLTAVLQPDKYISFTGGVRNTTALLGDPDLGYGYTYGVNATTHGSTPVQLEYFKSVQTGDGISGGLFELSQYSVQLPHANRFAASATYSEINFSGDLARTMNETFSADFGQLGRLGLHDLLEVRNNDIYGADWSRQFGQKGPYFLVGLDRQTERDERTILAPTAAVRLPLPWGQSLTFSYVGLRGSRLLQFQLGGRLLQERELVKTDGRTALIVQSTLTGQIYQDVNQDGKFEAGVDRPIVKMQVWLDEEKSTVTDSAGYFRFDAVNPGTHRVRADIATLPANLILANEDLMVAVMPYRVNRRDVLAFQSGQILGCVILVKTDDAGRELDQPFPDARIIVTGDRDTFSEGDGSFALADLPPGTYELRVDPATIPVGLVATPVKRIATVKPGGSIRDVDFHLARPVIMTAAPPGP